MIKKIVFFDFQGVLDVKDSYNIFDNDLFFQISKQADTEKVYRLFKFIYEEKACFASISSLSNSSLVIDGLLRSLFSSGNPIYLDFVEKFYNDSAYLDNIYFFNNSQLEKNELLNNENLSDYKIVVFEDEAFFDSKYNPVYIDPSIGLTDCDILKAKNILNNY